MGVVPRRVAMKSGETTGLGAISSTTALRVGAAGINGIAALITEIPIAPALLRGVGTVMDTTADVMDPSVSGIKVARNLAGNMAKDIVSAVPGGSAVVEVAEVVQRGVQVSKAVDAVANNLPKMAKLAGGENVSSKGGMPAEIPGKTPVDPKLASVKPTPGHSA